MVTGSSDCVFIKGAVPFMFHYNDPWGSKLSDTRGILSMIHDLLMLVNLLEGTRLLKLMRAKSTILQNR